jgi:hypothetical protein
VDVPGVIFGYNTRSPIVLALAFDVVVNNVEVEIGLLPQEPITCRGCNNRPEDVFIFTATYAAARRRKSLRQKLEAFWSKFHPTGQEDAPERPSTVSQVK